MSVGSSDPTLAVRFDVSLSNLRARPAGPVFNHMAVTDCRGPGMCRDHGQSHLLWFPTRAVARTARRAGSLRAGRQG
jgi:hypothetical protein